MSDPLDEAAARELEYHNKLYSGFAQRHFAKPAVVAFREYLVRRIVKTARIDSTSRVLSIGCGIGDTEILLARHAAHITGVDLSPAGIESARAAAARQGVRNAEFVAAAFDGERFAGRQFDAVIAVFVLHHLADRIATHVAPAIHRLLRPGGMFYALDPSYYRLSGFIGKLIAPSLMKKHQSEDEEELRPAATWRAFEEAGFEVTPAYHDFVSTPLAGLWPEGVIAYRVTRAVDQALIRIPLLKRLSSNFEVIARRPGG